MIPVIILFLFCWWNNSSLLHSLPAHVNKYLSKEGARLEVKTAL